MARILVVDDDLTIGELFKRVLCRDGHEVLVVNTGEQCLETISKERADNIHLVFLDLKMPGMGGEETLEKLRELYGNLPIVIITGYGNFQKWCRVNKKNIVGYVNKPFNTEYIRVLVRNKSRITVS